MGRAGLWRSLVEVDEVILADLRRRRNIPVDGTQAVCTSPVALELVLARVARVMRQHEDRAHMARRRTMYVLG